MIFVGLQGAFTQGVPEHLAFILGFNDQVVDRLCGLELLPGGIEKRNALPITGRHGFFQAMYWADLELEIFFMGTGVVWLVLDQVFSPSKLVPQDLGDVGNLPAFSFAEGFGLVKGQVIDGDDLGSAFEWDTVPAKQTGDVKITLGRQDCYQDQGSFSEGILSWIAVVNCVCSGSEPFINRNSHSQ